MYKSNFLYVIDVNSGAYCRPLNLVNDNMSVSVGFKPGKPCFLWMVHLYRNMQQIVCNTHII